MHSNDDQNTRSPSTRWEWKLVRVKAAPAPAGDSAPGAHRSKGLRERDAHIPMTIEVRYRGGPEASWLIGYRGRTKRFPGHLHLHDVLWTLSDRDWR